MEIEDLSCRNEADCVGYDNIVVESLPEEYRKMLRWRMSPITPNVVKLCIARSGFKATSSMCYSVLLHFSN